MSTTRMKKKPSQMVHLLSELSLSQFPQRVINCSVAEAETVGYFHWCHSTLLSDFLGSLSSQDWSLNDHTKTCSSATKPQSKTCDHLSIEWNDVFRVSDTLSFPQMESHAITLLPAPYWITDLEVPGES